MQPTMVTKGLRDVHFVQANLHCSPTAHLQKPLTSEIDILLLQEPSFRSGPIPGFPRSYRSLFVVTGRSEGASWRGLGRCHPVLRLPCFRQAQNNNNVVEFRTMLTLK